MATIRCKWKQCGFSYKTVYSCIFLPMVNGLMLVVGPGRVGGPKVGSWVIGGPVLVSGSSGNWQQSSVLSKLPKADRSQLSTF